ncbi:PIG-L deacetylase family protein [Candidatus Flexifilum breve]|uniref:PIG-L deacetylase family protein n=1 Tax=Candidatus Flexifilum breve TaxID=3140694 RepID=UPI0031CC42A8
MARRAATTKTWFTINWWSAVKRSSLEAAELVGVKEAVFLGYADGALTPSLELRRDPTRLIRRLRPDRVPIMDPTQVLISGEGFDYINHPDHRATGEASLYAIFPSAETRPIFPELLDEGLEPHHVNEVYLMMSDKPNIAIDVTAVWDKKIQSLLAHRSQVGEDVADMIRQVGRGDRKRGRRAAGRELPRDAFHQRHA